jgi:ribosomal protein S27AE
MTVVKKCKKCGEEVILILDKTPDEIEKQNYTNLTWVCPKCGHEGNTIYFTRVWIPNI